MLLDDTGLIDGKIDFHAGADRAEKVRLIALAIAAGRRTTRRAGLRSPEQIAALAPDFATLLRFIRREPALLAGLFRSRGPRSPADRGEPARRAPPGSLRPRPRGRADAGNRRTDRRRAAARAALRALPHRRRGRARRRSARRRRIFRCARRKDISALAFLLLRTGRASPHRLPLQPSSATGPRIGGASSSGAISPSCSSAGSRPSPTRRRHSGSSSTPTKRPASCACMMPGQFVAAKRAELELCARRSSGRACRRRAGSTSA